MPARLSSPKLPDVLDDERQVRLDDLPLEQAHLRIREAGLRSASEVHDDLDQGGTIREGVDGRHDLRRQRRQQGVKIVDQFTGALT